MNPDPIGHPSGSVNWIGEGQGLIFIGSSYCGCGLYDGQGYKVVEFPNESCNESNYRYRPAITFADVLGDPRQEIIHIWQGVSNRIYAGYSPTESRLSLRSRSPRNCFLDSLDKGKQLK